MKKFFWVFVVLAGAYSLLLYKPSLYFNKSLAYGDFTVRARGSLPASVEGTLESVRERVNASEMYKPGVKFELILPATRGQFLFFTPFQKGDYFRLNPFHGAIFLAAADFKTGEARTEPGSRSMRSLSGAITAAAAWEMTRLRVRTLTYIFMADWKMRGYGELLSGGSGQFAPSDACAGGDRPGLQDYKYGLMLETFLKQENTTYDALMDRNVSDDVAEARFRDVHCGR